MCPGLSRVSRISGFQRYIVLDIEGTTTPISFVADVLFPYARDNVGRHLSATYATTETQDDIKLLRVQGHIWTTGYVNNELKGKVYEDVPEALERWQGSGIKVYIYSSGSRLAQRLIFGNTNFGDLRKYLSGFFNITIGSSGSRACLYLTTETDCNTYKFVSSGANFCQGILRLLCQM